MAAQMESELSQVKNGMAAVTVSEKTMASPFPQLPQSNRYIVEDNENTNSNFSSDSDDTADQSSVQSYQPTDDSAHSDSIPNDQIYRKFTRQLSKEDATSIIGGLQLSPILTSQSSIRLPRRASSNIKTKPFINNDDNLAVDASDENIEESSILDDVQSDNETQSLVSPPPEGDNDDTKKIFNFSFPFSTSASEIVDGSKVIKETRDKTRLSLRKITKHYHLHLRHDQHDYHHHHHHEFLISKTFRKMTKLLPFLKSDQNDLYAKREYHPKSPDPPPGVSVYWDDISHVDADENELEFRERIELKLKRQESLDTIDEAKYYKDITHLDDGKYKALAKSLLPKPSSLSIPKLSNRKMNKCSDLDDECHDVSNMTNRAMSPTSAIDTIDGSELPTPRELTPASLPISPNSELETSPITEVRSLNNILPAKVVSTTSKLLSIPMNPMVSTLQSILPPELEIYNQMDGDVLIIGGYRGSVLRDSRTKRRTWIPVIEAGLNIRKINLTVGPNDEDELRELNAKKTIFGDSENIMNNLDPSKFNDPNYPSMYPTKMLTHIGPVDISKRLLKKLNSNPKVNAKTWGYDWRLSPELVSEQLHEELTKIVSKQREKKGVIIIAHSMGGIIAHGALVKDPTLVRSIVYAGTPMPCCNILGPIRFSDSILLSKDILTNEANFFMRSSYVFVPPGWGGENLKDGKDGGMVLFRDLRNGKRYKIDFWDIKNWVVYNLNPLVSLVKLKRDVKSGLINLELIQNAELKSEIKSYLKIKVNEKTALLVDEEIDRLSSEPKTVSWIESYQYLKRTLDRTKKYLLTFQRNDDIKYPPMAQIFSNGVPSVKYCLIDGEECIERGEYYKFFYGPGDGVVYQGWNFPRELGRKRAEGDDTCGLNSADPRLNDGHDWRGKAYGYGNKYAYEFCGKFRGTCGHIGLLADLQLVGQGLNALFVEERKRANGLMN